MKLSTEEKERRKEERRTKKWNETHKIIDGVDHKKCSVCNEFYPANYMYFYENKANGLDGLDPYCKTCTKAKSYQWIIENREQFEKTRRKHWETDLYKEYEKRNYNKKKNKGYFKEYYNKNKDRAKIYRDKRNEHKRHDISDDELEQLYQFCGASCMYCGISEVDSKEKYGQKLHKDHAINNGSNKIDNCVLACRSCNSSKKKKDWNVWYTSNNPRYSLERYYKIVEWLSKFV